jgi:hypothetical protein
VTTDQWYHIDPTGIVYTLADGVNSWVSAYAGFGVDNLEIIGVRAPGQHGQAFQGIYMPTRTMTVMVDIAHTSAALWRAYDEALRRACSPFKAGSQPAPTSYCTLRRVTSDGRTRDIHCWLVSYPEDSADLDGPLYGKRLLKYAAPDPPFFYDPTAQVLTLSVGGTGGITFPITFPITFTSTAIDETIRPENTGDIETWPTIRLYGPGVNPQIENVTTGYTVNMTGGGGVTLDAGDYLDVAMGLATVTFHDASAGTSTDVTYKMSAASAFWPLIGGVNAVRVRMASSTSGSAVFTFFNYYQGV